MTHISHDCNEEYPSDLIIQVKYSWTDDNQLHVGICAMSTKPTYVNISSHCLFNLAGHVRFFIY
jgi:aldose 1-epimerase